MEERNRARGGRRRVGSSSTMLMVALCCGLLWTVTLSTMHGVEAFGSSTTHHKSTVIHPTTTTKTPTRTVASARPITTRISLFNKNDNSSNNDEMDTSIPSSVWSPGLRKIIAGVASLGAMETGYLTYVKLANQASPTLFCGSTQSAAMSCDQVLNGPYSNLPFFEQVPLAALGVVAYSSVVGLALWPLNGNPDDPVDDTQNRIFLTALTTAMGTFSIFLMTLLFSVLQANCPYCVFSAADSFLLANLALIGGCLPEGALEESSGKRDTTGGKTVAMGFAGAVLSAILVFGTGSIDAINANAMGGGGGSSSTLLATTLSGGASKYPQSQEMILYAPPEITTESSSRALSVAKSLSQLDAKMYGAHWCSHCYDQKQTLGKQVFDKSREGGPLVEYVECSKDGINSQNKVCKAKEIPGYPTWEIQGKQYPGEQSLDELEDLIKDIRSNKI